MDLDSLADRFGASSAEPIHLGFSDATVVRLERSSEAFFYKAGQGVDDDADRLADRKRHSCPRVLDRGDGRMLMSELAGHDAAQPWPEPDQLQYGGSRPRPGDSKTCSTAPATTSHTCCTGPDGDAATKPEHANATTAVKQPNAPDHELPLEY